MKSRNILFAVVILGTLWQTAVAQPKKKKIQSDALPLESILAGSRMPSNFIVSDLIPPKPEMPLGPQDVLKSYEIAMSQVAEKTENDFAAIVQSQQANQINREQAEYLLQQRYQIAVMTYQVLSALHDVLQHDIDEEATQLKRPPITIGSDEVVVVAPPSMPSGSR